MLMRFQLRGTDAVLDRLLAMASKLPQEASQAAFEAAKVVEGKAKSEGFYQGQKDVEQGPPKPGILTSRTGNLRSSIRSASQGQGRAVVGPTALYGAIHEFGGKTSAHTIVARRKGALRFMVGGQVVFAKRVVHPGSRIPPRPYLRPAFENNQPLVQQTIINVLAREIAARL